MNEEVVTEHNAPVVPLEELKLDELVLGETPAQIRLNDMADNRLLALGLAQQARRTLDIFTRDLEPAIYDQEPFLNALRELALRSQRVRIRVLLQDASRIVQNGHRLVELMRRLTTFMEIRQPHQDYRDHNEAFLVADGVGIIHRRLADRPEGLGSFKMPLRGRELTNFFDEVWERSQPHPDLRRLFI